MKIKIVIVDDHSILREGLRSLLELQKNFSVVGEAGDARSALICIEETVPDVLILDIGLPDEDGLQVARKVVSSRPGIKIIILSSCLDQAVVGEALRLGAVGFLSKDETSVELVRAILTVLGGKVYLSPSAATNLAEHLKTNSRSAVHLEKFAFSDRELEVLKLVVEGLRNKEIADRLGVGIKSIESYRSRLMTKAGCSTPAELVRFALKEKLISS